MIFPTPKYLKIKKKVSKKEANNPRLVLVKRVDAVNRIAINTVRKNTGSIPNIDGSIK